MFDPIGAFGSDAHIAAIANAIQIASGVGALVAWHHMSCDHSFFCLRHGKVRHGRKHYCAKHHPDLD